MWWHMFLFKLYENIHNNEELERKKFKFRIKEILF